MTIKQSLFLAGCLLLSASLLPGCSYDGGELFQKEGCIICHRFKGRGGSMGPDLTAVTARRDDSSMENYLKNPRQQNHSARMPSFAHLSRGKRKAIIAYLKK